MEKNTKTKNCYEELRALEQQYLKQKKKLHAKIEKLYEIDLELKQVISSHMKEYIIWNIYEIHFNSIDYQVKNIACIIDVLHLVW